MQINGTLVKEISDASEIGKFVRDLQIEGKKIVIKPNWVDCVKGSYVEANILRHFFENLDADLTVVESYTGWRNRPFSLEMKETVAAENAREKWDFLREEDQWFLEYSGIGKLLEEYSVQYINITEEVWNGRKANKKTIQDLVESKFGPIKRKELYDSVPKRLYDLHGNTMLSLSKVKTSLPPTWMTITVKNLYGLIPHPVRMNDKGTMYHGKGDSKLAFSILDTNKVYASLFDIWGVCEGIYSLMEGNHPLEYVEKTGWGYIIGGKNRVTVDIVAAYLAGADPEKIQYLKLVGEAFGGYDLDILKKIPKKMIKPIKMPEG